MTVRCIYCNSNAQVDWGGEFFKCRSCELVYRRTMPGEADLIEMYSQCYSQDKIVSGDTDMDSGSVALRNHADFIGSMLRPPARGLDYGAGTGELVQLLSDRGYRATGCEPSANAREEARRKYGFSLFSSLDEVQEGSCDLVVAVEVVEHLSKPWVMFEKFADLLAPEGRAYIATPSTNGLLARLLKSRWREAAKPFHLVFFNYPALDRMALAAGFRATKYIRYSPLTADSVRSRFAHRTLQFAGLYGGVRAICYK